MCFLPVVFGPTTTARGMLQATSAPCPSPSPPTRRPRRRRDGDRRFDPAHRRSTRAATVARMTLTNSPDNSIARTRLVPWRGRWCRCSRAASGRRRRGRTRNRRGHPPPRAPDPSGDDDVPHLLADITALSPSIRSIRRSGHSVRREILRHNDRVLIINVASGPGLLDLAFSITTIKSRWRSPRVGVRDVNEGYSEITLHPAQFLAHLNPKLLIERGQRFVQQQHLGR